VEQARRNLIAVASVEHAGLFDVSDGDMGTIACAMAADPAMLYL
jgi:hypothetical protein